jgi:predicted DCC family thiol-disulfide oxidoreductase YuxK
MVENRKIIIFDGVCNLCNRWVQYIVKRDPTGVFSFAPMQSDMARKLIAEHHGEEFNFETILLYKNGIFYERSDAVIEITRELPRCGFLFRIARITPKPIRDFFYRIVARHRYRVFGKRDQCMVPTEDMANRFI